MKNKGCLFVHKTFTAGQFGKTKIPLTEKYLQTRVILGVLGAFNTSLSICTTLSNIVCMSGPGQEPGGAVGLLRDLADVALQDAVTEGILSK